jgi:hypothetical protein
MAGIQWKQNSPGSCPWGPCYGTRICCKLTSAPQGRQHLPLLGIPHVLYTTPWKYRAPLLFKNISSWSWSSTVRFQKNNTSLNFFSNSSHFNITTPYLYPCAHTDRVSTLWVWVGLLNASGSSGCAIFAPGLSLFLSIGCGYLVFFISAKTSEFLPYPLLIPSELLGACQAATLVPISWRSLERESLPSICRCCLKRRHF